MKYLRSAAALSALLLTCGADAAKGALAYGLTSTGVVTFDTDNPAVFVSSSFTGLLAGDNIVDIDYRPANGTLYALVEVPATRSHWVLSFLTHWTMLAELAIWVAAAALASRASGSSKMAVSSAFMSPRTPAPLLAKAAATRVT